MTGEAPVTDEQALVDRLAVGDRSAFQELVEAHKKKVYYLAYDMLGNGSDAEDVSQEVFIKVFRSFGTFKRGARLGSWIYRIAYNTCIDHLRKRDTTPEAVETQVLEARPESEVAFTAASVDPLRAAERELLQRRIERALEKVSPQEKAVFLLRHYDDLMLKDIAEALGLSVGSVKSYLFRAVKKLQRELGAGGGAGWEVSHD